MKIDWSFMDNKYTLGIGKWFDDNGYFRWIVIGLGLVIVYLIFK